jgi:nitrate/TMAO reductase-like tetraheme cytochrome c subunit
MKEFKLPRLVYNWVSLAGVFVATIAGLLMLVLLIIAFIEDEVNPYFGVFLYMVLPPFFLGGLFLIPIGMYRHWKRVKRGEVVAYPQWPYIDLNIRSHRNASAIFFFGTIIFLALGAIGSYEAFHYTESVAFCGKTCHIIMKPEYTAYQESPHARVACVSCHVGPGAGWYAKSKLSGAYQVYATAINKFPRPIPTPIKDLRPAQETCEQCHWPEKFFGSQQKQFDHFMYDSANTHWPINLLIKTGGGDPSTGQTAGIHWHMNIGVKVEYIHRDEKRLDIPWVRVTDKKTGKITVYQNEENPLTEEEIKAATPRIMDCVDCHNRPSHFYNSPDHAADMALLKNHINDSLPYIKTKVVKIMAAEYETEEQALNEISKFINDYYRNRYPNLYAGERASIDSSIRGIQQAFAQNIFPEMKVRWDNYSSNIGHFIYPGCMRCHEGKHKSAEGKTVTRECIACHTILAQGSGARAAMASTPEGLIFEHPDENTGEAWMEMGCYECHSGVQP